MKNCNIHKYLGLSLLLACLTLSLGACSSIGQQRKSNKIEQIRPQDYTIAEDNTAIMDTIKLERLWQLREIAGTALPDSLHNISLNIQAEAGKVNGLAGCNRFFASLKLGDQNSINISNIGSTRMACPHLSTEYRYLQALERVQYYHLDADKPELLLNDKDGKSLLRFE